jgi:hypothetical protein
VHSLRWTPPLAASEPFQLDPGASLSVDVVSTVALQDPAKSSAVIRGDLRDVALNFVGSDTKTRFVTLHLRRLAFESVDGAKTDLHVDLGEVVFAGALRFVATLTRYVQPPAEGTAAGPYKDVTPDGVTAGLAIPIPSIEFGAFLLQNLAGDVRMHLPFDGKPARLRIAFSSRQDPFLLTVMALGGGGHFAIAMGVDEVEVLEMALEFGAAVSLNLGVAKGSAKAVGGFYDKLDEGVAAFEGYVKFAGSLRVLGLVTVSAQLYLSLTYYPEKDKASGQASMEVEIDLGLFEKSVSFTVKRTFGGEGDPGFALAYPGDVNSGESARWAAYCKAFADGSDT